MKFRCFISFLFIFISLKLQGQGLILNDDSYNNVPRKEYENDGAKGESAILKDRLKVDLKPFCPTVREQGKISSCVGWSVGYAAMTIEKAIANHWANDQETIDNNAYSAMFVYNQIKLGDCNFGAELNNAFSFLKEKGNVFYRDFAADNDCDSIPFEKLIERARLNRVGDFATLFKPDDKPDVKIERVKITLANNKPVVIGMLVLDNFLTLKSSDRVWYPNVGKTDMFGGHAMVVVGYDDGMKAFEVMNSWGKGWANQGFVWIRYDDFAKYCKYAYQLILDKEDRNYLEGNIHVRRPVVKSVSDVENVIFSAVPFIYKNNRYQLSQQNIKLPLEFQLVAEGLRKDSYLYVISFDKTMKSTVHWPRNEKLNKQFVSEFESAQISAQDYTVTVPGKYNVFSITEPGIEYLCVLNSNIQIRNLSERLMQMKNVKGDLPDKLQNVFNTKKENSSNCFYDTDKISFYASKGEIVFIVLEFEINDYLKKMDQH